MINDAGGARLADHVVHFALRDIEIDDVASDGIVEVTELGVFHAVVAIAEGGDEFAVEEKTLRRDHLGIHFLHHATVVGAAGGDVGVGGREGATADVDRRWQGAPVAGAIGAGAALGEIISDVDAIVGVGRIGAEGAAGEHEPRVGAAVVDVGAGDGGGEAVAAEPCPFWLQRIGGGEARFAAVAVVDVARPRAVKIHAADVGVGRATDAERAVGLSAQRGRVAIHHVHDGTRFLVVVREVED